MSALLVGYARCSTETQDLAAQRYGLAKLGVAAERIYVDRGLTGTNRAARPGRARRAGAFGVTVRGRVRAGLDWQGTWLGPMAAPQVWWEPPAS